MHSVRLARISQTPEEIFREAIANSLDAYGRRIWLRTNVENRRGRETVLIDLSDDGMGMNLETIKAFFNLSDSVKPKAKGMSGTVRRMTGYKGHGTKIYYNSECLEVLSYDGDRAPVWCIMQEPRGELADNRVPNAEIQEVDIDFLKRKRKEWHFDGLGDHSGTSIRVTGYHGNTKAGLEHSLLKRTM
jgi:hypothetical protein